jgi:nicotinate-nucleotide adenylyltransferase
VNVALFGGTFDPVHTGHLAAAHAAIKAFELDQIHFAPASVPPHKRNRPLTAYEHRYAMVAIACAGVREFFPSLLEAPEDGAKPNYSLDTVRKMQALLSPGDRLYFIVGADAFWDVPHWHEPVSLLDSCHFIVVNRPGFPIEEIARVLPEELRREKGATATSIALARTHVHLLNTVEADISSSNIRQLASKGQSLAGLVPAGVAEYIQKLQLYTNEEK